MPAVERRAHQQAFEYAPEAEPRISVLNALQKVGHRRQHDKLCRRHADRERDRREKRGLSDLVEQMVSIVRPER